MLYSAKALWFDAGELDIELDAPLIVKTARGTEFGWLDDEVFEASEDQVKNLKSELKPVLRLAEEEDVQKAEELRVRGLEAMPRFRDLVASLEIDMRPIAVEFLFDGDKAVFYFEAEERVDFRNLVHKLASEFKIRVDMRQIGVRDEARMVGGLGHCGQELCCRRLGGEFCPVSIRMAKEQDLSLNPQKISGVCGRLMCCLRYEYEAYRDFKSRAPKVGATIETPQGPAKVSSLDVPKEIVTLHFPEGADVHIPLADMDAPEDGGRPTSVSEESFERATAFGGGESVIETTYMTSRFTQSDALGQAKARYSTGQSPETKRSTAKASSSASAGGAPSTKRRRDRGPAKAGGSSAGQSARQSPTPRKRRRSTTLDADGAHTTTVSATADSAVGENVSPKKGSQNRRREADGAKNRQAGGKGTSGGSAKAPKTRPRRSSGKGEAAKDNAAKNSAVKAGAEQGSKKGGGMRPGHRSSSLSQSRAQEQTGTHSAGAPSGSASSGQRRSRSRSHKSGGSGAAASGNAAE